MIVLSILAASLAPGCGRPQAAQAGVVSVASTSALLDRLQRASPGEVIVLAPGVYTGVRIQGFEFDRPVEIRGQGAIFRDLLVRNSRGLTFRDLTFQVQPEGTPNQFVVMRSQDVRLHGLNVHGPLAEAPLKGKGGLMLRESTRVGVSRSTFHQTQHGLTILDCTDVEVLENRFHNLQTDGLRGGGNARLVIRGNDFRDFFPAPGDHPDAIQQWTTHTTRSGSDIVIEGNVIARGQGAPMQGVFLRDGKQQKLPYQRVRIAGNALMGTLYNGIMVDGGDEIEIVGNLVVGFPDQKSWIRLESVRNAVLTDNTVQLLHLKGGVAGLVERGNRIIPPARDGGRAAYAAWKQASGAD